MSDGSFDYAYARAWQFADELAERLDAGCEYSPETVAELPPVMDRAEANKRLAEIMDSIAIR